MIMQPNPGRCPGLCAYWPFRPLSPDNNNKIIGLIKTDPQITAPKIAMELVISTRGVEKNLRHLREAGIIKRVGSPTYGSYWENIIKEDK